MVDRILIRMPNDFEYFMPAVSVAHEYMMQLQRQGKHFVARIELGNDDQLFFSCLFPRIDIVPRGKNLRSDWDCVLDLRDTTRAYNIAKATKLHLTAAWGVLFGGSPGRIPNLGYLGARVRREELDVLIDSNIPLQVLSFFERNYPDANITMDQVDGLRPATMFDKLCGTKMYIGRRSGATYLAATMGKYLVELYPDDLPSWWLSKPEQNYSMIYGKTFSSELIWAYGEELWQILYNTKCQGAILMDRPASIVDSVAVR